MAVMMPREKWTDERLDDLNVKVDAGFARVEDNFKEQRAEMRQGFETVNARIDNVLFTLLGLCGTIIVALIAFVGTVVLYF